MSTKNAHSPYFLFQFLLLSFLSFSLSLSLAEAKDLSALQSFFKPRCYLDSLTPFEKTRKKCPHNKALRFKLSFFCAYGAHSNGELDLQVMAPRSKFRFWPFLSRLLMQFVRCSEVLKCRGSGLSLFRKDRRRKKNERHVQCAIELPFSIMHSYEYSASIL